MPIRSIWTYRRFYAGRPTRRGGSRTPWRAPRGAPHRGGWPAARRSLALWLRGRQNLRLVLRRRRAGPWPPNRPSGPMGREADRVSAAPLLPGGSIVVAMSAQWSPRGPRVRALRTSVLAYLPFRASGPAVSNQPPRATNDTDTENAFRAGPGGHASND